MVMGVSRAGMGGDGTEHLICVAALVMKCRTLRTLLELPSPFDEWDSRAQLCLIACPEIALDPTIHVSMRITVSPSR
jgi:hypothetical protein